MEVRAPVRVTHTYTQTLHGPPAEVFPLFCPVREAEWVPGWNPRLVLSESGLIERDCAFVTPDPALGLGAQAVWVVLRHDAPAGVIELLKVTPGFLLVRLVITVRPRPAGGCSAELTYAYTALSPAGEAHIRGLTPARFAEFMQLEEWALNAFLRAERGSRSGSTTVA